MAATLVNIVRFHEIGGPEVLRFDELPLPEPGPGEARLRVKAIGLNRAEVMFRNDRYLVSPKLPSKLGHEASGIVEAVGPGVDPSLLGKIRSTVPGFPADQYGVYGEVAIVPVSALAAYPEALSFEQGTSIWMQYLTAYGALIHHGRLRSGDFVVITAASSSVGIAAIEITLAEGAIPIAVTRTIAKKAALLEAGAKHVIVSSQEDVAARVLEITGGSGARLLFDPIGGPEVEKLATAAARGGILFLYGALSPDPTPFPLFTALSKGLEIRGYTLIELDEPEVQATARQYVYDRLASGQLNPRIDRVFPYLEIAEAQRYMEQGDQIGKIVVKLD
ncbi:NADPH:quinone reductase [bacterium SCN 62-11]|nr:zinc-dependent alcohol dehydrogenase family protein [Candidatus Eremiobacteraeota bacterium]ODT60199.1 MAG: NADPH:quinone reductase [bacterium SCN 62-11]